MLNVCLACAQCVLGECRALGVHCVAVPHVAASAAALRVLNVCLACAWHVLSVCLACAVPATCVLGVPGGSWHVLSTCAWRVLGVCLACLCVLSTASSRLHILSMCLVCAVPAARVPGVSGGTYHVLDVSLACP